MTSGHAQTAAPAHAVVRPFSWLPWIRKRSPTPFLLQSLSSVAEQRFSLFRSFIYFWAGIRNALRPSHARITVEADGQSHQFVANTVLVSNIGKIGDINLRVSPDTSPHDGMFDVTIISSRTFWDVLVIIFRMLTWRWPLTRRLRHVQARSLLVRSQPPVPVQIDGEKLGMTPLRAEILPSAVELIVGPRYT